MFHKSEVENDLAQKIDTIQNAINRVQVVLGNERTESTVLFDLNGLKRDNALSRFGWLSERRAPLPSDGKQGDFYVDSSTMKIYKRTRSKWLEIGTLKGDTGSRGPQGLRGETFDPFYMLPFIVQNSTYYVYVHPSRFSTIDRREKGKYSGSELLDFHGKKIATPTLDILADEDHHHYVTLDRTKTISTQDEFDSLFEGNKAFAIFQVFEIVAQPTSVRIDVISVDTHSQLSTGGLSFQIAPNPTSLTLGKFYFSGDEAGTMTVTNGVMTTKLNKALGVSSIQEMVNKRCVLSYARNLDGKYTIHINSVLIFSHPDSKPFTPADGSENVVYHVGGSGFQSTTAQKCYCQLHFTKSLPEPAIKRIHTTLMTHYGI